MSENLLLDTCALIWLACRSRKLSPKTYTAIDDADIVYVSTISAWEIGLKVAKGQLTLSCSPREWFARAMDVHSLTPISLSLDVLMTANELPWHHRDPADRFITATAILQSLIIVTTDKHIAKYPVDTIC